MSDLLHENREGPGKEALGRYRIGGRLYKACVWYFSVCGVVLSISAGFKAADLFIGAPYLQQVDALTTLPNRVLVPAALGAEVITIVVLAFGRSRLMKAYMTTFMAAVFCLYRGLRIAYSIAGPCPCMGAIGRFFQAKYPIYDGAMMLFILAMLIVGCVLICVDQMGLWVIE